MIAADENIVATSLVGDHYVEAAIIYRDEEGEVVDGILDEVRTRGGSSAWARPSTAPSYGP
nr:hypothetical protein GCM10020093_080340 [Planobispora longispora]